MLTLGGLTVLATGALFFDFDVGFSAFVLAVLLSAVDPAAAKGAVGQIAWSTVLLVCGIVAYVSLMETLGTIDYFGESVAAIGVVLVGALAISASVVDSSPFSTSGSLIVANSPPALRELIYRRLLQWGFSMVALVPVVAWLVLVVPGWL